MPNEEDDKQRTGVERRGTRDIRPGSNLSEYVLAATVVLGITLPAFLLRPVVGPRAVALIYLLTVVVLALFVGRGPILLAATLSALFWDFFFLAPIPDLRIHNAEDSVMFAMYLALAIVLGQLTSRIREQEKLGRELARRSTSLYLLTRGLAEATDLDQLLKRAVPDMERAFSAQIAVLLPAPSQRLSYHGHPASTYEIAGPEQPVADWVFENAQPAGKFTKHLPATDALFVPLQAGGRAIGVLALSFFESSPPTAEQWTLLETFARQLALVLDRHRVQLESEKAKLLAESERLSKTLLNSMSHEIRTPLAAILGATSNLLDLQEPELSAIQQAMIAEIQEATERLNQLVGKVLDITRLESGCVKPKVTLCDLTDLVQVALRETKRGLARHQVAVELPRGLPLVPADFVLLQQALMNLLSNAATHTPAGTAVQVSARVRDGTLVLSVADRGPGIDPESLPRVFDKFYRGPTAPTGGTGLGLSVVKGFVEAQGGEVRAENRAGGGAVFTIRLPLAQAVPISLGPKM